MRKTQGKTSMHGHEIDMDGINSLMRDFDKMDEIKNVLGKLSKRIDGKIVKLVDDERVSFTEIARHIGITHQGVKYRYDHAKSR